MDAKAAIDLLNTGECTCVDYGKINDMPFFCTCGVGFDAFVSLKFADSGKRGLLTYLENTLHESLTYEPETYEIENEEGTIKYKAFLIACANASQYGNNALVRRNGEGRPSRRYIEKVYRDPMIYCCPTYSGLLN